MSTVGASCSLLAVGLCYALVFARRLLRDCFVECPCWLSVAFGGRFAVLFRCVLGFFVFYFFRFFVSVEAWSGGFL